MNLNGKYAMSNKANAQQAVWQYGGATNIFSTFCSLFGFNCSRRITPSNKINNELLIINLTSVTDWTNFKYRHIAKPYPLVAILLQRFTSKSRQTIKCFI